VNVPVCDCVCVCVCVCVCMCVCVYCFLLSLPDYINAAAMIIVFDLNNTHSFFIAKRWVDELTSCGIAQDDVCISLSL